MTVSDKLIGVWKDYVILLSGSTINVCSRKDIKKVISKVSFFRRFEDVKFSDQQIIESNVPISLLLLKDNGILIRIPPFWSDFFLIVPEKYKYIYYSDYEKIKKINIERYLHKCHDLGDISEDISDCMLSDNGKNILLDILRKNIYDNAYIRTYMQDILEGVDIISDVKCEEKIYLDEPQAITYLRSALDYSMCCYIISDGKWRKLRFSNVSRLFQTSKCILTGIRYIILIESTLLYANGGIEKTKHMTVNIYNWDSQKYLGSFRMDKTKCSKVAIYGSKFILSTVKNSNSFPMSGNEKFNVYTANIEIIIRQPGFPMWDPLISEKLLLVDVEKFSLVNHYIDSEYTSWLSNNTIYSEKHKL